MKAIVLAGGRGTRLHPHTLEKPKPLLLLEGRTILEILFWQLASAKITHITLCLGYMAESFESFLVERRPYFPKEIAIETIIEPFPLGTAGALKQIDFDGEDRLVLNGDILTNMDFMKLLDWHQKSKSALTIASKAIETKLELGVLEVGKDNQVVDYKEKPLLSHVVSMGIYVYSPDALAMIGEKERLDFPDLVLRLLENGRKVSTFLSDANWIHIGTPEQFRKARELFTINPDNFLLKEMDEHP